MGNFVKIQNQFEKVPELKKELQRILNELENYTGKVVDTNKTPLQSKVPEKAMFHEKQSDGSYVTKMKIGNQFHVMKVDDNNNVYWAPE